MTPFEVDDEVNLRLLGGQTVDATVVRPGRWWSLVSWGVRTYWETPGDMGPGITRTRWRPNWRMWVHR